MKNAYLCYNNNCIPFSIQVLNTYIKPMEKIYTRRPLILYIYVFKHTCTHNLYVLTTYKYLQLTCTHNLTD
jgi:hypothetical protein